MVCGGAAVTRGFTAERPRVRLHIGPLGKEPKTQLPRTRLRTASAPSFVLLWHNEPE